MTIEELRTKAGELKKKDDFENALHVKTINMITLVYLSDFKWILLLIVGLCISSETKSQRIIRSDNKIYIDFTRGDKHPFKNYYSTEDNYYIIFNSHATLLSKDPKINSIAGHSWVVWAHQNPQTQSTQINGYGFWPNQDLIENSVGKGATNVLVGTTAIPSHFFYTTVPGVLLAAADIGVGGSPGSVPGRIKEDIFGTPYSNSIKQVVIAIDKAAYNKSLAVVEKYKQDNPNYKLVGNDCTTFFIEVGKALGLDMPSRSLFSPSSLLPTTYMDKFIEMILSQPGLTIDGNNGSIHGENSGVYTTVFENKDYGNYNSCKLDKMGNRFEEKYRDGQLTCTQVDYANGQTWYKETALPFPGYPEGISNQPISEFRFANGNTILSYNPATFNPNNVPMNLASGNQSYLGAINNEGEPNGVGSESDAGTGSNGALLGGSKTGKFINGKFIDYTGVNIGVGMAYGKFNYGRPEGEVRIEYNDGHIYTGTFSNNMANGQGSVTNKEGTYSYTGSFKDGYCSGHVLYWERGGKTCEGTFEKGKMIYGKVTLPNGESFIGTFDSNGNPKDGKAYDKNNREKANIDRGNYRESGASNRDFNKGNGNNANKGNSSGDFCTGGGINHEPETCGDGGFQN